MFTRHDSTPPHYPQPPSAHLQLQQDFFLVHPIAVVVLHSHTMNWIGVVGENLGHGIKLPSKFYSSAPSPVTPPHLIRRAEQPNEVADEPRTIIIYWIGGWLECSQKLWYSISSWTSFEWNFLSPLALTAMPWVLRCWWWCWLCPCYVMYTTIVILIYKCLCTLNIGNVVP